MMPSVGMVGNNGREMARAFLRMSQGAVSCYHITEKQPNGPDVNVLVAAEAAPVLVNLIPRLSPQDYLVINADDTAIFPYLSDSAARLITYGFNSKACITASSVTDEGLQVCIQRAFLGMDGQPRTPQEFSASLGRGETSTLAQSVLGAAAAWAIIEPV